MMVKEASIAITQLVLWYDSTRIQTWPSMLAKADPDAVYRSTRSFGAEFYTDRTTKSGHSAADNTTKNLPGLEKRKDSLVLRGVGFMERVKGGYQLSASGIELAEMYRNDPKGIDWVVLLGKSLLTREPRTRTFIKMLSCPDAVLYFSDDIWWGGSIPRATISFSDGSESQPFVDSASKSHLRDEINGDPIWALGDWRQHKYICDLDKKAFVGLSTKTFSLHAVATALRAACEVFLHLGVIYSQSDRAWLDQQKASQLFGTSIADDFGWEFQPESEETILDVLAELISQLQAKSGYVVASELRTKLLEMGFDNPDLEIANLESSGKLTISETDYGHSRHGIGLFDDQSKQLIKIRLN